MTKLPFFACLMMAAAASMLGGCAQKDALAPMPGRVPPAYHVTNTAREVVSEPFVAGFQAVTPDLMLAQPNILGPVPGNLVRTLTPSMFKAPDPITRLRLDPSPELRTVAMTADQRRNQKARAHHLNKRQIIDDWDLFWLQRDPMKMSKYPIP